MTVRPPNLRKLPPRFNALAVPFFVSLCMSGLVSGVSTLRNVGLVDGVFSLWVHAWMPSWAVAFPALFVLLPAVRRLVALFVEKPRH